MRRRRTSWLKPRHDRGGSIVGTIALVIFAASVLWLSVVLVITDPAPPSAPSPARTTPVKTSPTTP